MKKRESMNTSVGRKILVWALAAQMAALNAEPARAAGPLPVPKDGTGITTDGTTMQVGAERVNSTIGWQSFDIGQGYTVQFLDQSGHTTVNKVDAGNPSSILGSLLANGTIYLLNPDGILFGSTAKVNVGGLVASSMDYDPTTRTFSHPGGGDITVEGGASINAGAFAYLVGKSVNVAGTVNSGDTFIGAYGDLTEPEIELATANGGKIVLQLGDNTATEGGSIELTGDLTTGGAEAYSHGNVEIAAADAQRIALYAAKDIHQTGGSWTASAPEVSLAARGDVIIDGAITVASGFTAKAKGKIYETESGVLKTTGDKDQVELEAGRGIAFANENNSFIRLNVHGAENESAPGTYNAIDGNVGVTVNGDRDWKVIAPEITDADIPVKGILATIGSPVNGNVTLANVGEDATIVLYKNGIVTHSGEAGKGDVSIAADKAMVVTRGIQADNDVDVTSNTGHVFVKNSLTAKTGSVNVGTGEGNIHVGADIASGQDAALTSGNGNIHIGANIASGQNATLTTGNGKITVDHLVTAKNGNVSLVTGAGVISINDKVIARSADVTEDKGNVTATTGEGNIHIGDNGENVETVSADQNIALATNLGEITISGKASTQNGDITMQAGANSYDTPGQSNFTIDQNGKLESGRDITLKGRNGDIHISNKTSANRNVTATIDEQGSIYFDNELNANGSVSLSTENGDIHVGKDVTSSNGDISMVVTAGGNVRVDEKVTSNAGSVTVTTKAGDIEIGDNGENVKTVSADKDITLATNLGKIHIKGATESSSGDITMSAKSENYTSGTEGMNILLNGHGHVKAAGYANLQSENGDIHVTGLVMSEKGLTADVQKQGSVYFDRNVAVSDNVVVTAQKGDIHVDNDVASINGDITMKTTEGNVRVNNKIISNQGSIAIATEKGNIEIGDSGENVKTVSADQDITLATDLGKIKIEGETLSKQGDITISAKSDSYTPGSMNILMGEKGKVQASGSVNLQSENGDLIVTDRILSGDGLSADVHENGSVYFGRDVDVKEKITIYAENGDIQTAGNLVAGNAVELTADGGSVTVLGGVTATAGNVTATAKDALTINKAVKAKQDVTLTSTEGAISTGLTVTSTDGSVTATADGNITINNAVYAKQDVTLTSMNGAITTGSTVTSDEGNANFRAHKDLTLTDTVSVEHGSLTAVSTGGKFTTANDLAAGKDITIQSADDILLPNVKTGPAGNLSVTATDGDITQAAGTAVEATGATALSATGAIALANEGNDFGGTVSASGKDVTLTDKDGIQLGDVTAKGLTVTATGGDITQADGTAVTATGATALSATGAIALANEGNDFQEAVSAKGTGVALSDGNAIVLANVDAGETGDVVVKASEISATGDITAKDATLDGAAVVEPGATVTTGTLTLKGNSSVAGTINATTLTLGSDSTVAGTVMATTVDATGHTLTSSGQVTADGITAETLDVDGGKVSAATIAADVDQDGGTVTASTSITGDADVAGEESQLTTPLLTGNLVQHAGKVTVDEVTGTATLDDGVLTASKLGELEQSGGTVAAKGDRLEVTGTTTQSGGTLGDDNDAITLDGALTQTAGTINAQTLTLKEDSSVAGTVMATTVDATGHMLTSSGQVTADDITAGTLDVDGGKVSAATIAADVDQDGGTVTGSTSITGDADVAGEESQLTTPLLTGNLVQHSGKVTVDEVTGTATLNDGTLSASKLGELEQGGGTVAAKGDRLEVTGTTTQSGGTLGDDNDAITLGGALTQTAGTINAQTLTLGGGAEQTDGATIQAISLVLDSEGERVSLVSAKNDFGSAQGVAGSLTIQDGTGGIVLNNLEAKTGALTVATLDGGNITVPEGSTVKAENGTATLTANGDAIVNGTVDAKSAIVVAENGSATVAGTLKSADDVLVKAGNDATLAAGADIEASGSLMVDAGNRIEVQSDLTAGRDLALVAGGGITVGGVTLTAGNALIGKAGDDFSLTTATLVGTDIGLETAGNLTDAGATLTASGLLIAKADGMLSLTGTASGHEAGFVSGDDLTLDNVVADRFAATSTGGNVTVNTQKDLQLANLSGAKVTGEGADGGEASVEVSGLNGIQAAKNATLNGRNLDSQSDTTDNGKATPKTGNLTVNGDELTAIPGLIIYHGRLVQGNPDLLRKIRSALAFGADTPELKTTQGVFGSPLFLYTDVVLTDKMPTGYVDYLLRTPPWLWNDAFPTAAPKPWLEQPAVYPLHVLRVR